VTPEAWITLAILMAVMVLFATEKLPADIVALLGLAAVLLAGVVSPAQALSGFSSEATITVAAMFVLSAGIQKSGVLLGLGAWLGRIRWPSLSLLLLISVVGPVSAFMNNTAAVAVLLPLVVAACVARRWAPSRLLIPLSFAAQMGGVCTLVGTSTNLLVNSLVIEAGLSGFSLFEFSRLGVCLLVAGGLYLLLLSRRLLPDRTTPSVVDGSSAGAFVTELRVPIGSNLVGAHLDEHLRQTSGDIQLLALRRGARVLSPPLNEPIALGDILLVQGGWDALESFAKAGSLRFEHESPGGARQRRNDALLIEAIIAPNGRLVGQTLRGVELARLHDATVLGIQRRGERLRAGLDELPLAVGDILLMAIPPEELPSLRADAGLVLLDEREPPRMRPKTALLSTGVLALVVVAIAQGWLPIVAAALLGCISLVAMRVLTPDDAYSAIDWRVIVLLAGAIPLGLAMQNSGLAAQLVSGLMAVAGPESPLLALAAIYLVTAVLTEVMSNNGAAVLLTPIAISTATALGVDYKPFVIAVMFAASTSFATPVGYQTNTMVYNAGGYRFTDFLRIGIPLNLLFWALCVWLIPYYFPFR
jgi:di/tricarboxylate transporter